jgi:hypothetical protein
VLERTFVHSETQFEEDRSVDACTTHCSPGTPSIVIWNPPPVITGALNTIHGFDDAGVSKKP